MATIILAVEASTLPTTRRWLALGLLVAAATLTRYAGVVLLPACIVALALSDSNLRRKLYSSLTFSGAVLVPVVAWLVRNLAVSGSLTGNRPASGEGVARRVAEAAIVVAGWFLPRPITAHRLLLIAGCSVLGFLLLIIALGFRIALHDGRRVPAMVLCSTVVLGGPTYLVLAEHAGVSALDNRLMAPFAAPLMALLTLSIDACLDSYPLCRSTALRGCVAAVIAAWLVLPIYQTVHQIREPPGAGVNGPFNSPGWRRRADVTSARSLALPPDVVILSNQPYGLTYVLHRRVIESPVVAPHLATQHSATLDEIEEYLGRHRRVFFIWVGPDPYHYNASQMSGIVARPTNPARPGTFELFLAPP
jgi:hypothetical protein